MQYAWALKPNKVTKMNLEIAKWRNKDPEGILDALLNEGIVALFVGKLPTLFIYTMIFIFRRLGIDRMWQEGHTATSVSQL